MFEVDVDQVVASSEVHQLFRCLHIVAFAVEHSQMLEEADIKKVVDLIERDVKLFQLFKCLDALHLS